MWGEQVLKEMNYLMREREELEEERFRQLDEAIRGQLKEKHIIKKWTRKNRQKPEVFLCLLQSLLRIILR